MTVDLETIANSDELEACVADALREAKELGAEQAEVVATRDMGLSVSARLGDVESIEYSRDQGLGITVYLGKRKGSANTGDLNPDSIRGAVHHATDIARYTEEDPCHGLADRELMADRFPDLDNWHPWKLSVDDAVEMAIEAEAAGRAHSELIVNSDGATVDTHGGASVYGNSHGFVGTHRGTRHHISTVLVAGERDEMERDYWYSLARRSDGLESPQAVGKKAAERCVARVGARQIKTVRVPVLFAPEVARGLLGHLVRAVSGGSLYRRASFLLDAAGEQLFPDFVQISEEPLRSGGLGSATFDSEGVSTRSRDLVRDGILQGYVLGSYAARKLGLKTTGNAGGVHNLTLQPGQADFADLLKEMGRGLVVTEVMGQGVNNVTGDYSRGASGFWVEEGEIVHPVNEVTIASNLRDMFKGMVAVGSDVDKRAATRSGSILIDQMMVAGG